MDWPEGWSTAEKEELIKEYHEWNGDPEEFDPEWLELSDWSTMSFMSDKLRELAEKST